jgi:hypothetical protein
VYDFRREKGEEAEWQAEREREREREREASVVVCRRMGEVGSLE